jgi:hypothetical protein
MGLRQIMVSFSAIIVGGQVLILHRYLGVHIVIAPSFYVLVNLA